MKISVAACELPHPEGTAAGRDLWAWCEGVRALGHDLDCWVWFRSPSSPAGPVPDWCEYRPLPPGSRWRAHLRAVTRPRGEAARAGWRPADGAVAVADHLWSFAAVEPFERSVATFHFRTPLDALAVGRAGPATVQMTRAEQRAGRRAALVVAYSSRVGRHLRQPARTVPIAYPVPPSAPGPVDRPVAGMLADWSWPPNRRALGRLLAAWPEVRHLVPGAELRLGGRNLDRAGLGTVPGVVPVGAVGAAGDFLAEVAVVAFPCPPSSGPKVKVLEALAHGLPVVTTTAGVEGLGPEVRRGTVVAPPGMFARALAGLLGEPRAGAALGRAGRAAVAAGHSPEAAARARLAAFADAFGLSPGARATTPVAGPAGTGGVPASSVR